MTWLYYYVAVTCGICELDFSTMAFCIVDSAAGRLTRDLWKAVRRNP